MQEGKSLIINPNSSPVLLFWTSLWASCLEKDRHLRVRENNIHTHVYRIQATETTKFSFCGRMSFVEREYSAVRQHPVSSTEASNRAWTSDRKDLLVMLFKGPKPNMQRNIPKSSLQFWKTNLKRKSTTPEFPQLACLLPSPFSGNPASSDTWWRTQVGFRSGSGALWPETCHCTTLTFRIVTC